MLSLKGKITVFNALIFSLLQYPTLSTVTPPMAFQEVKKIATRFIWDNKKSKVAYNTMIQTIADGGLQVMDLKARVETNLIGWIRHIFNDPKSSVAEQFREITGEQDLKTLLRSNFEPPKLLAESSPFYMEVLKTWASVHIRPPTNEHEVRAEILWNNKYIPLTDHQFPQSTRLTWASVGITRIQDICHTTEDRVLGLSELQQRYGIQCSFLQAFSLRSSNPHSWRTMLTPLYNGTPVTKTLMNINNFTLDVLNSSPKKWYRERTKEVCPSFCHKESWSRELNNDQFSKKGSGRTFSPFLSRFQEKPNSNLSVLSY